MLSLHCILGFVSFLEGVGKKWKAGERQGCTADELFWSRRCDYGISLRPYVILQLQRRSIGTKDASGMAMSCWSWSLRKSRSISDFIFFILTPRRDMHRSHDTPLTESNSTKSLISGIIVLTLLPHSNLQSLHLWQIFRKICPQSSPSLNFKTTTHHHIPLSLLTPSISASPLHYLTSLTLVSSISDSITSLHSLSTLPNLVSLHVNGDSSSTAQTSMINDDTIRLWNKRAKYDKTVFPCLRYLFLRFQLGITELALGELNHVPKLETLVTSRCGVSVREAKKITKDKRWKMTR